MEEKSKGPDLLEPNLIDSNENRILSEKKNEKNKKNNNEKNTENIDENLIKDPKTSNNTNIKDNNQDKNSNNISYADILKKNPKIMKQKPKNLEYKSCIKNAIVVDLGAYSTKNEAIDLMKKHFDNANKMNYIQKKSLLEVGFKSQEEQLEAKTKIITIDGKQLRIERLNHISDIYTVIKATNVNLMDTVEETKETIFNELNKYGEVRNIIIPLIENKWQEPEATIYMKFETEPPREIKLDGVPMLLNWKGATPRCRFCKRSNHLVADCRNLKRKIENEKNRKMIELANFEKRLTNNQQQLNESNNESNGDSNDTIENLDYNVNDNSMEIVHEINFNNNDTPVSWEHIDEEMIVQEPFNESQNNNIENKEQSFTGKAIKSKTKDKEKTVRISNKLEYRVSTSLAGLPKKQRLAVLKNAAKSANTDDTFSISGNADE